jgi:hypothetical protein
MAAMPHSGDTAKHNRHKARQIGEGHHHAQQHLQREDRVPESHPDIWYARQLLLVRRECPDIGQIVGKCLMLKTGQNRVMVSSNFC